jgi:O-antigen/teichoic acid export membrane protein
MRVSDIANIMTSRMARQFTLVLTGNICSAGLGFLAVLLISRNLTVSDFGLFSIARSFIVVGSLFAGLGIDIGMIKSASSYLKEEKAAEASHVCRATFLVIAAAGSVIAAVVFTMAEVVSLRIFHYPNLIFLIKLASAGILGVSTLEYLRSVFYTYQLFQKSVILQLSVDVLKFLGVVALLSYLTMDVRAAVAVFAFAPLLCVFLGLGQLRHTLFSKGTPIQNLSGKLFSYGKWLFISNICNTIFKYVGIFMLAELLSSKAAGIYGLALTLAYIFPILMDSLRSVLLPEVSRFTEIEQFERYVKGSLKISFYLGIAVIPILFLSGKIVPFFFGPRYLESVPIFNLLLISAVALVVGGTMRVALYSLNKPHVLALVDMTRLTIMVLGCYLLIPSLGVSAPAVVALILNVSIVGFLCIYVLRQIKRKDLTIWEEAVIEPYSG